MAHKPSFNVGDTISNDELRAEFRVGNMGGMRKSNAFNCLVIISDHTKGLYEDKWYGDELHYTGMGKVGDQVLEGNQNKTLYYSNTNGIEVHLFEVLEANRYIYCGVVELSGNPYQEIQIDDNGNERKVWMFPVRPICGIKPVLKEKFVAEQQKKRQKAEAMNIEKLKTLAKSHSSQRPGTRKVVNSEIVRNPYVAEYAKRRANGICQLCGNPAPFKDRKGTPYLESHHIEWLSEGGADSIENTVALCPNCHRKMHIINNSYDKQKLLRLNQEG